MANWLAKPERGSMRAAFRAECAKLGTQIHPPG